MKNRIIYSIASQFSSFSFCCWASYLEAKNDFNKKINLIFLFDIFRNFFKNYHILFHSPFYFGYLEIPITTKCTLKCKNCANLIPCYDNPINIDIKNIEKSLDYLLKCISQIVCVRVLGGEPFLHPKLGQFLTYLLEKKQILRIEVVTNGSVIITDKKLIQILKNPKIVVSISNYKIVSINKFISILEKNHISYYCNSLKYWNDYGDLSLKGHTNKVLKKQYRKCHNVCKMLINGNLYICPRQGHSHDLVKIIPKNLEYVCLNENKSIDQLKNDIKQWQNKNIFSICSYCNRGTSKFKKIEVAEQINDRRRK